MYASSDGHEHHSEFGDHERILGGLPCQEYNRFVDWVDAMLYFQDVNPDDFSDWYKKGLTERHKLLSTGQTTDKEPPSFTSKQARIAAFKKRFDEKSTYYPQSTERDED